MTRAQVAVAWRFAALAGVTLGLGASVAVSAAVPLGVLAASAAALAITRPVGPGARPWLCLVAGLACLAGLCAGTARLEALDRRALEAEPADELRVTGFVLTTPRESSQGIRYVLGTARGVIAVRAPAASGRLRVGDEVAVAGTAVPPEPWEAGLIARQGARAVLLAASAEATGARRGGVAGAFDAIRRRAEAALSSGTTPPAAALARGFVLGQDEDIPDPVRDEFRRSGLGHLLAVSGQNVMLLALLAAPILALAGVPLRLRLLILLGLIAIYVPVAGAGPSIQRAGIMGAAGIAAALAGRPASRWYAIGLAAAATLALDPRASADIGWQLSFAAVIAIATVAPRLIRALGADRHAGMRRALAEGAGLTIAATLATAPLAAHHFATVSLTALPANVLALPAVAPAMWLGMLTGALGQIPGAPVESLSWAGGVCCGYIAWVAHVLGGEWAQLDVTAPSPLLVAAWALALSGIAVAAAALILRRRGLCAAAVRRPALVGGVLAVAAVAAVGLFALRGAGGRAEPRPALAMTMLDVGQGDSILLRPRDAPAVLVDTGAAGTGAADRLRGLGADVGAVVITHDQSDHSGALGEVIAATGAERIAHGPAGPPASCDWDACPPAIELSAGDVLRSGRLRLEVLWPPAGARPDDPNAGSLVLLARHGGFSALLTGDAEAEAARFAPEPVDVLKVAHHGSADAGLAGLLERATPALALVSTGAGNPYGHPAPDTLEELAGAGVPVLRTDEEGEIEIAVTGDGWAVG